MHGQKKLAVQYECPTGIIGTNSLEIKLVSAKSPIAYAMQLEHPTLDDVYEEVKVSVLDFLEVPLKIDGIEQTVTSRMRRDQKGTIVLRANESANFNLFIKPKAEHELKSISTHLTAEFSYPDNTDASLLGYKKNNLLLYKPSLTFHEPIDNKGKNTLLRFDLTYTPSELLANTSDDKISSHRGYVRGSAVYSARYLYQNSTTPFEFRVVDPDVANDLEVTFEKTSNNMILEVAFKNKVDYDLRPLILDIHATCVDNPGQSVWARVYGDRDAAGNPMRSQTKSILPGERFAFTRDALTEALQKSPRRDNTGCSRFKINSLSVGEQYYLSTQRTQSLEIRELYL